jgi:hypothetical protein
MVVAACTTASAGTEAAPDRGAEVLALPSLGITVTVPAGTRPQTGPDGVSLALGPLRTVRLSRLPEKPTFADAVSGFVRGGALSVHAEMFGDSDYTIEGGHGYGQRSYHRVRTFPQAGTYACDAQVGGSSGGGDDLAGVRSVFESLVLSGPR